MNVYLSRLLLNPRSRQVLRELAQPYEMHRTLMHAFDKYSSDKTGRLREELGVLFRAEANELNPVVVYVQSLVKPDWSYLGAFHNYLDGGAGTQNPACKEVTAAYRALRDGQVLQFRLRANPTKRIAKPANGEVNLKGKRVGLLREDEQLAWLVRKGQEREKGVPGGFEILMNENEASGGPAAPLPRVVVQSEGKQSGCKRTDGRDHRMTHLVVSFDGLLRVTDAEAFRASLASGIGSAKAFGFGLLSVARTSDA